MAVFMKRDLIPPEFLLCRELVFIQSTGAQYIDTGFKPSYNSRVVMDISDLLANSSTFVFGVRDEASGTATNQFGLYRQSTKIRSDYFGSNQSVSVSDTTTRTIIDKNENVFSGYGVNITNTAVNSGQCANNLTLFALNTAGKKELHSSYKMYSCQIYDNGVLVRDFVPAQLKSTDEIGLWDKVEKIFYGNAGTGVFIAGEVAA